MTDKLTRTYERKFGTDSPDVNTLCRFCGTSYGDHRGTLCPPKGDINPENTYNLHASAQRTLNALEKLVTALDHMGVPEELTEQFAEAERALAQAKGITTEVVNERG